MGEEETALTRCRTSLVGRCGWPSWDMEEVETGESAFWSGTRSCRVVSMVRVEVEAA